MDVAPTASTALTAGGTRLTLLLRPFLALKALLLVVVALEAPAPHAEPLPQAVAGHRLQLVGATPAQVGIWVEGVLQAV